MKNTLTDLNNHLFAQLERLNSKEIKGTELQSEIERAKAVSLVSREIVNNARIALDAQRFMQEWAGCHIDLPEVLENKKNA